MKSNNLELNYHKIFFVFNEGERELEFYEIQVIQNNICPRNNYIINTVFYGA